MAPFHARRRYTVIGGGNGSYINGTALVDEDVDLTLITPPADSGGSTGRIRGEKGEYLPRGDPGSSVPVGDCRRAIHALSQDEWRKQAAKFRFPEKGRDIDGHAILNLLLEAFQEEFGVLQGIKYVELLFNTRGKVLPATIHPTHLKVQTKGGRHIEFEHLVDDRPLDDEDPIEKAWLEPRVPICRDAADAITAADIVTIAFSDLYSSIISTLRVEGMPEVLREAQKNGTKIWYEAPLMDKWGETQGYSLFDFIKTIIDYTHLPYLDRVLVNKTPIPEPIGDKYWTEEKARPIRISVEDFTKGRQYVRSFWVEDLLSQDGLREGLVRHDSKKLGRALMILDQKPGGRLDTRLDLRV